MAPLPQAVQHAIAETPHDAVIVLEGDTIVWCDAAVAEMLGLSEEELVGRPAPTLVPRPERDRMAAAISSRTHDSYVIRGRHPSGAELVVEIRGRSVECEEGTFRVSTLRDLTARRAMEEELERRAARNRLLFDAAADGMMVMNGRGQPTDVNSRLCEMLGRPREQILTMSPAQALADLDTRPMQLERLATESSYVIERQLIHADGTLVDVEVNLTAIGPGEVLAVIRDIRDRKRAAAEQAALRDRLQHAQSLEALGRLAGGVAHDFNNLLTVILGASRHLEREGIGQPAVREIVDAAERAADLTEQLLTFSQHRPRRVERIDAGAHLTQLAPLLRRLLGEAVTLELTVSGSPLFVRSDSGQLTQIVMNLVVNARDAMDRSGLIDVELAPRSDDALLLRVRDRGHGIAPEALERIFEPFFSTKRAGRGTGLGLSTVYGIVKAAGGEIDVESSAEGSTFLVTLPLDEQAPDEAAPPQPTPTLRVLLVEDDDAVRRVVEHMLLGAGHFVVSAKNLEEAREVAQSGLRYDVLLTDVVMPDGSGVALAEELGPERVLFMSGYPATELRANESVPVLSKPFTAEELAAALRF